jgi:hypothetical protein
MNTLTQIPYTLSTDFVALTIKNKPYVIVSSDARFAAIKELIKARDWSGLEKAIDLPKVIETYGVGSVKVYAGVVTYKNVTVNGVIVNKILEFVKEGFPFEPLAKFLDNLMQNPNQRSVEQLYSYIERYKLPITEDGMFLAMKSVRNDFKDHHTGTVDNSPGQIISMARELCDPNPNVACASTGYHVGNYDYVSSFGSGKVVLVDINPRDVVSCPIDSSYQKLRVCTYKVIAEIEDDNSKLRQFESNLAENNSYYAPLIEEENTSDFKDDPNFKGFEVLTAKAIVDLYSGRENSVDVSNAPPTQKQAPKRDSKGRFIAKSIKRVRVKVSSKPAAKKLPKRNKSGRFI